MSSKKEIIDIIMQLSGKYAPYNIFSDWVQMSALAIQNACCLIHNKIWQDREQAYIDTARKYTDAELELFGKMFVLLGDALTENLSDVLGEIYMETGMGSKYTGQFFTPFHLSELCARMCLTSSFEDEMTKLRDGMTKLTINEPSCGGGGMIIAACKVLHDNGVNFQKRLRVVAQDLDWKGVYMTYLQLSLIGCNAIVVQGDTLCEPYDLSRTPRDRIMRTPMNMGALI